MKDNKKLTDILTSDLLDMFPSWDEISKEPVCLDKYDIAHRQYTKQYDLNNEYKYLCVDSRECWYKTDFENRRYCQVHLKPRDKE